MAELAIAKRRQEKGRLVTAKKDAEAKLSQVFEKIGKGKGKLQAVRDVLRAECKKTAAGEEGGGSALTTIAGEMRFFSRSGNSFLLLPFLKSNAEILAVATTILPVRIRGRHPGGCIRLNRPKPERMGCCDWIEKEGEGADFFFAFALGTR